MRLNIRCSYLAATARPAVPPPATKISAFVHSLGTKQRHTNDHIVKLGRSKLRGRDGWRSASLRRLRNCGVKQVRKRNSDRGYSQHICQQMGLFRDGLCRRRFASMQIKYPAYLPLLIMIHMRREVVMLMVGAPSLSPEPGSSC